jgi:hypothetical protein
MNGRDGAGTAIRKQYRDAIGNAYDYGQVRIAGRDDVGCRRRAVP